ncbi:MAG: peroxiredoxin [Parcubacteria group bacterium]|nr:peroxiredoxin [Parcubacteria group bacterium]
MTKTPQLPKHVPDVMFRTRVSDENVCGDDARDWQNITTGDLFRGKKVVLFALPGAFTPTCDSRHLPGYEDHYDEFKKLGIDDVFCLSVNDTFVMNAWGKKLGFKKVRLIPDGSGEFTEKMGMLVRKDNLGFGARSWRYSAYVEDGEIKKAFIEPGFMDNSPQDPFEVSGADTMLKYLKSAQ